MRLAKLCITLALALGGWHDALASALCARRADCHASAREPHAPQGHPQTAGRETHHHGAANAADDHGQTATPAAVVPANANGHCGPPAESPRADAHTAPRDAEAETAHGDDENASPESVTDLRAPASSCAHCVGRQTRQPVSVNSAAPGFARDSHATPAPAQHLVTLTPTVERPRFAPNGHAPPRGRPLHLLNSALLI